MTSKALYALLLLVFCSACQSSAPKYDLILRNGVIYDGSGNPGYRGDVAVSGDSIVAVGNLGTAKGAVEVDVQGKAIAPGFVNMLSWSTESLLADGRSQGDIRQGVM